MLPESVLIAILALNVIIFIEHLKWRSKMGLVFAQSADDSTDLFSQATDHLAFIADCMEESAGNTPMPAAEGMPQMDMQSIFTRLLLSKVMPQGEHGSTSQSIRKVSEEESNTQKEEAEV
jgi:hypothetical protein